MTILGLTTKKVKEFCHAHNDGAAHLKKWEIVTKSAKWTKPTDVLKSFPKASPLKNNRVVFHLVWNKYRLIIEVLYDDEVVLIKFIGPHSEYEKIDAENI